MNLLTTLKGSLLESFFPAAWDLTQWDACIADDPKAIFDRQPKWHKDFSMWVTLRHAASRHIPSTWMPAQPGILFFTKALAGPLVAEVN